jgi:mono/diheme cytochrome c family protein
MRAWCNTRRGALAAAAGMAFGAAARAAQDDAAFRTDVLPVLAARCASCHGADAPEAGLDLTALADGAEPRARPEVWAAVRDRLAWGEMPPAGAPQPAPGEVERVLRWIDRELEGAPAPPARATPLRRLNNREHANTVRDLLGVDFDAVEFFPRDPVGHGFDTDADAATLPNALLEKHLDAAAEVAARAIAVDDTAEPWTRRFAADELSAPNARGDAAALYSNGAAVARATLPRAGRYRVRSSAWAQQAGDEVARLRLDAAGRALATFDVGAAERTPETYAVEAELAAAFVNDHHRPDHPDPAQRDRNLYVRWIEVAGPLDPPAPTAFQAKLFARFGPELGAERLERTLAHLAGLLWRRPPEPADVERLVRAVRHASAMPGAADAPEPPAASGANVASDPHGASEPSGELDPHGAPEPPDASGSPAFGAHDAAGTPAKEARHAVRVQLGLELILASPRFLYRLEPDPPGAAPGAAAPVDGWALATRLAYFLWSSAPDAELRARAADGTLVDGAVLAAQVERMLADPRARALADGFAAQWLELGALDALQLDRARFPEADRELLASMRAETLALFRESLRERRDVRELLTADHTFVDARLAAHYGLDPAAGAPADELGAGLRRVSLANTPRRGLLGHASVLAATSNPTRTSPVKRGKWVLQALLGQPPPPPPPGADRFDESPAAAASASLRERLARHRADPACAACHARMDAIGFGLEHFGPTGRWREEVDGFPIDASAVLPGAATAVLPGDATAVLPDDATAVLPDDATAVLPGDATAVLPGDATAVLPDDATAVLPGDATAVLPGDAPAARPEPAAAEPSNNGVRFDGARELAALLARDDAFVRTLVAKLATYALGRGLGRGDRELVRTVFAGLDPERPTLAAMIRGIALSPAFRERRVE